MSRSGYCEDSGDHWAMIRWRGAVASALRGRRGQALLKEMLAALDALPNKRLVRGDLVFDGKGDSWDNQIIVGGDQLVNQYGETVMVGDVCALGAVGLARGLDMVSLDPEAIDSVADSFGIASAMAREIVYINDEDWDYRGDSPEARFDRVRAWVASKIQE